MAQVWQTHIVKDVFTPQLLSNPPQCKECLKQFAKFWETIMNLLVGGHKPQTDSNVVYILRENKINTFRSLMYSKSYLLYKLIETDGQQTEILNNEPLPIILNSHRVVILESINRPEMTHVKLYLACTDNNHLKRYVFVRLMPVIWNNNEELKIKIVNTLIMSAYNFGYTIPKNETVRIFDTFDEIDLSSFLVSALL